MKLFRLLPLLLITLTACFEEPERLDFATDPRILRGTWVGSYQEGASDYAEGQAGKDIQFVLNATYLNQRQYRVTGTMQIGSEATLNLEGTFDGSAYQLYTQAAPPASLQASLQDDSGQEIGTLRLYFPLNSQAALVYGSITTETNQGALKIRRP